MLHEGETSQYYNWRRAEEPTEELVRVIAWNALPAVLIRQFGRQRTLEVTDTLYRLSERMDRPEPYFTGGSWRDIYYRPQDEYCEWRVDRDRDGRIRRVTFTAEPPEYWQALHGDTIPAITRAGPDGYRFTGDRDLLVELYRRYVDPRSERCSALPHPAHPR